MTTLYLIRHGATKANLDQPYRLQGCRSNPALADVGVRQAELTGMALAGARIDHIYTSPLRRALQTARIIGKALGLRVRSVAQLTECDVGRWGWLTWDEIRSRDEQALERFEKDPGRFGYPDGENFNQVAERTAPAFETLLGKHAGESILVVGHKVVNRVFLAGLLGLSPSRAKRVKLDNCGISIVTREGGQTHVATLNATFHLRDTKAV